MKIHSRLSSAAVVIAFRVKISREIHTCILVLEFMHFVSFVNIFQHEIAVSFLFDRTLQDAFILEYTMGRQ